MRGKLSVLSRISLDMLQRRNHAFLEWRELWKELRRFVDICFQPEEHNQHVREDIGIRKIHIVFESVLRESEREPTHPSVRKNVPILLDVIVGICEYDQHLLEGGVIVCLARTEASRLLYLSCNDAFEWSMRCRFAETLSALIECSRSRTESGDSTKHSKLLLHHLLNRESALLMARELASCGSYLVQGNLMEISVQLLLLHAQTCDSTEGVQFVRHFCEAVSSHEVTVQSLSDMLHSVVQNSGPERPSLVDRIRSLLNQINDLFEKRKSRTVFSYLAKKVLLNDIDCGSKVWVDFGDDSFTLSVNEGDSTSRNEGETSLICASIASILEVKARSPVIKLKLKELRNLLSECDSEEPEACFGRKDDHMLAFEFSRSEFKAVCSNLSLRAGVDVQYSSNRKKRHLGSASSSVSSSCPTASTPVAAAATTSARACPRKRSMVDSLSLLSELMKPLDLFALPEKAPVGAGGREQAPEPSPQEGEHHRPQSQPQLQPPSQPQSTQPMQHQRKNLPTLISEVMSLLQSSHQSQLDRLSEYESSVRDMRDSLLVSSAALLQEIREAAHARWPQP